MNLAHPQLDRVLTLDGNCVAALVIEQPQFFRAFLQDIDAQLARSTGRVVLSQDNRILPFDRHAELIDSFLRFRLGRKPLLTRLTNRLETLAMGEEYYMHTTQLTCELEHETLFIFVNLRSYYSDAEVEAFFASVLSHEFLILPMDGVSRVRLSNEQRITIDDDLCAF